MKMKNRRIPGMKTTRRLVVVLTIVLIAASCSSTGQGPIRPQSTGKTIKSASTATPDNQPVITSTASIDPGVTDVEIIESTGVFMNEEAARRAPDVVAAEG